MSCIEKMVIQGVRSFGPSDKDKQMITFFTPLTLILGPNGTGKTTIIECLKYITTGVMPAGASKNAAFIHDPKVVDETEVNAQIRLKFRNVQGQVYFVTRSIRAIQKAKNIQMKTLEGVITTRDPRTGRDISISSKCTEIDHEMINLLGVAKPILDSVIFCHQEDSNWPLSEGKELKTRFDDIFASTRYVRALDSIRKTVKEQDELIKHYQTEIKYLKQNRDKANELQAELSEKTCKYEAACEVIQGIKSKIQPVTQKLEKLRSRGHEIYEIQTMIEKKKTEEKQIEKACAELTMNIKELYTGSVVMLKQGLHDFEWELQKKENGLEQCKANVETLTERLEGIREEKAAQLIELGVLKEEAQRFQQNLQTRDAIIMQLKKEYDILGYTGKLAGSEVTHFINVMQRKQNDVKEEFQLKRVDYENKESVIQSEIDELRKTQTKLDTELSMKTETKIRNKNEIRQIRQQLNKMEASAEQLKRISNELKFVEQELKASEDNLDIGAIRTEIKQLISGKDELNLKLKGLDEELNQLTRESTLRSRLTQLEKDRSSKRESSHKLKSSLEDSLKHLLGCFPNENLRKHLDQCIRKLSQQLRTTNKQLQELKREKTEKETQRKMIREQLRNKEEEIHAYQDRLNVVSGTEKFEEGLDKLQADLKKAQDEKGNLKGVQYMYKKYQETLRGEDPPCPLCHRPFDSKMEVDELIDELEKKMCLVPDKLERVCAKIEKNKKKVEELIQLKPVRTSMLKLKMEEIPQLEQKIQLLSEQIEKIENDISEKEEEVDVLASDEQMAQNIQGDVQVFDKLQTELQYVEREIGQLQCKLSPKDQNRSIEDVQDERMSLQDKIELISRNIERKQKKINEQQDKINELRAEFNTKHEEMITIKESLQQRTGLEEKKAKLEDSNMVLEQEIKECNIELQPLNGDIREKEKQKQKVVHEKETQIEEGNKQINKISEGVQQVEHYNNAVESYRQDGKDKQIQHKEDEIKETEKRALELSRKKEDLLSEIDQMKDDLATQNLRKREMSDNLALCQKQEELKELRLKISKLSEQLDGLDVDNLETQQKEYEKEYLKLTKEREQAELKKNRYEEGIKILRGELKSEAYKDAQKKFSDKMIDLKTTEQAKQDLNKYYKALDRTIMSYHKDKMAEINRIIQQLWINTYKGNDIETIEIRSDEEEGSGIKNRRTFNYRVVMIKNDVAVDMRNRCSAGQKVLASIMIRLALAECFCINCGVLALDEPTTNLDRENIESLAQALVQIIETRSQQRNFQLIIITHDEDLVELLGRCEHVDEFFKVRKNHLGFSRLVRARVEDLHSR